MRQGKSLKSTDLAIWISHIGWIFLLPALLLTGLRIAAASGNWVPGWLIGWLPQGESHYWHLGFAAALLFVTLSYLLYLSLSRQWYRYRLTPGNLRYPQGWLRLSYMMGQLLLLLALLSGLGLYLRGDDLTLGLHLAIAWALVVYLLLHLLLALGARGLSGTLAIFIPRRIPWVPMAVSGTSAAVVTLLLFGVAPGSAKTELYLSQQQARIDLDGEPRERVWQALPSLTVETRQGSQGQGVPVTVKAFHDGERGYFLLQWPDSSRSLKHLPLVKTAEGWRIKQTSAANADENHFYEDKLALMLSRSAQLAGAGTVHLGAAPLDGHPASAGGRGLHYSQNGDYVDVWHWKAVRTGLSIGQADDNYFGPPSPSDSEYKRFTAGYQKDPDCEHLLRWEQGDYHRKPECGGYKMNWKEYGDAIVQPLRLPRDSQVLKKMGLKDLSAEVSDYGRWWLNWDETVAYDPDRDNLPLGTLMPSVLSLGAFSKGRGGIAAGASWQRGVWSLELSRQLQVDNRYDLPLESGIHLWLSVFDHSQTRHSYHLRPLTLVVE